MSHAKPPENQGAISTMPYTARIPASSNCVTYTSSELYTDAVPSGSRSTAVSGATGKAGGASSTKSRSGASATQTGGSAAMECLHLQVLPLSHAA